MLAKVPGAGCKKILGLLLLTLSLDVFFQGLYPFSILVHPEVSEK